MSGKTIFIAAIAFLVMAVNCHSQKRPIKTYSFSFAENNAECVLEIEVSEGQPRTNCNLGTKIIEVRKDSVLIGRMESIRLPDYNIGESFQVVEQENNLLCIQQSFGDGRYIVISILRFEYSAGKMLLNNYEESRVDRFAEVQDFETNMISMQGSIDMNEIDDELIYSLHSVLFSYDGYDFFSETVYKMSYTYIEKGERGNETSERTYYFVKDENRLKKYRDENGRISKEIEIRALRHMNSILLMIVCEQVICSLYEIKFMEDSSIAINDDVYVLEKESYDRLYSNTVKKSDSLEMSIDTIFSLFSMTPYFLIDGYLSIMPYLFCNIERYKILNGSFSVEDPHSNRKILRHACAYEYDKNGNLASMTFRCETPHYLGVDYHLEFAQRTGKEVLMKESYSLFERMSTTRVIHFNFGKQMCDMFGDYFQYPTSNEFTFSRIIRCEKMRER